jgi:hypothetical protein
MSQRLAIAAGAMAVCAAATIWIKARSRRVPLTLTVKLKALPPDTVRALEVLRRGKVCQDVVREAAAGGRPSPLEWIPPADLRVDVLHIEVGCRSIACTLSLSADHADSPSCLLEHHRNRGSTKRQYTHTHTHSRTWIDRKIRHR